MREKRWKKVQAGILTLALITGLLSMGLQSVTVQAAGAIKTINLGASALAPEGAWNAENGHRVYFGKYEGHPTAFRVLKMDEDTMMLDCDTILLKKNFDADVTKNKGQDKASAWKNSDLEIWLNGNDYYRSSSVFTSTERNAIVQTALSACNSSDYKDCEAVDYVYLLSEKEADALYANDTARKKSGDDGWWLRSAYTGELLSIYVGRVGAGGSIGSCAADSQRIGVSPVFNLNLPSVLLTSASGVNKSSDALTQITADNAARAWKLTLTDHSKRVAVTEGKSVTKSGNTVTVPYTCTGSDISQISVMITSGAYHAAETEILYYGRLHTALSAAGTGTFTLPDGLPAGYKIYIMAEDVNDGNDTDYASKPVELTGIEASKTLDAPAGIKVSASATAGGGGGMLLGVNDTMEYSTDGGSTWISVPAGASEITGLAGGKIYIRVKATGSTSAGNVTVVEIPERAAREHSGAAGPAGTKDDEPKTGDTMQMELYATLAMISGMSYLMLLFEERSKGMTKEEKDELVSAVVTWGKAGGRLKRAAAAAMLFVILFYYHSIGKRVQTDWKGEMAQI